MTTPPTTQPHRIIIAGRHITITGFNAPIDAAFTRLHEAYYGNTALPWAEFEIAAHALFDAYPKQHGVQDQYFSNFTVIWRDLHNNARHDEAERLWQLALEPALTWEQTDPGRRIHKGTPYYFWAMTALLRGDIDRGYLLAHQALDEDIKSDHTERPNSPAFALVSLNYGRLEQAFRPWVVAQAHLVEERLDDYRTVHHRSLTLDDVAQRYLDTPPTNDTLFLLTYTIARVMRLAQAPAFTTRNAFAGQLQLNLLFDLTIVIDASIKGKNPSRWKFIDHVQHLLNAAGAPLSNQQLGDINGQFHADFDRTIHAALDGTLTVAPATILNTLQRDVAIAYGIRNYAAHNTASSRAIWERYGAVHTALWRVLFAVIDFLY